MCDEDVATYWCRLTSIHGKTEIKKTVNHTIIRKGMLDICGYVLLSVEVR